VFLAALGILSAVAKLGAQEMRPDTYGTSNISYIEIPAEAFLPTDSGDDYHTSAAGFTRYSTTCGGYACFAAPLRLPSGAKIVYLELDFLDVDAANYVNGGLTVCDYKGQNCTDHPTAGAGPLDCRLPGQLCSGTAYAGGPSSQNVDMTADGITVNNFLSSYRLQVGAGGPTTQIAGMIVGYVLQVSPAPGTPTFNDVPTNHPFFQFIEALAASGITGGCGNGNYCPDAPLTRGQMAVFLAKALGLQWP
jgi:hypothetical protein